MRTILILCVLTILLLCDNASAQWVQVIGPWGRTDFGSPVSSFAVSGNYLFAGDELNGVFVSTDNGTSWTDPNPGLKNTAILALAVSGSKLFAGTDSLGANGVRGVFVSTDNGVHWSPANSGLPVSSSTNFCALAVSGPNLVVGTEGKVQGWSLTTSPGLAITRMRRTRGSTRTSI